MADDEGFAAGLSAWVREAAPGEQRALAARRMLSCRRDGTDILFLAGLQLRALPHEIGMLPPFVAARHALCDFDPNRCGFGFDQKCARGPCPE